MLRFEDVAIALGDFRLAADLAVPPATITAVLGPSGAGKSTLLSAVGGFIPLHEGRILWNDTDLGPVPPGQLPVSMIFQDQNLFPHLTAAENVALGLKPSLRLTPEERERVDHALARTGLAGLGQRRPAELSGGQQSRVALARMVLRHKPIALLDEPFSALGPALRTEMLDLVAEIAAEEGTTLLMVTHDPDDARRVARHAILVAEGVALPPQATEELFANPPEALRRYLGVD